MRLRHMSAASPGSTATCWRGCCRLEEDRALDPGDAVQLYPPYLDVMQGLLRVIDGWVAEGTTA